MKLLLTILVLCLSLAGVAQKNSKAPRPASKPFVLGQVVELPSKVLAENRTLNIYLPEGYNPTDTARYPVIYLLDGSADEDFIHIVGLVQFCSFEWIKQVPKSIVVGIASVDRRRDFTYPTTIAEAKKAYPTTGGSDKFISFIDTELQPFIEKNFKTNQTKTLIGQSLGGLLATEILLTRPQLFNRYIIVSPSLWWDNGSLLDRKTDQLNLAIKQPTQVYIGVGKEGLMLTPQPHVMEVDANLLADKLQATKNPNLHVLFDYLPQENHATILHQAALNAFRAMHAGSVTH